MKKLVFQYGLKDVPHYYRLISEYFREGLRKEAKEMFLKMPKSNQIKFTKECLFDWHTIEQGEQVFYFNLLTGLSK